MVQILAWHLRIQILTLAPNGGVRIATAFVRTEIAVAVTV